MLSLAQKREFHEQGFIKVSGAVPKVTIDTALRAVNHSIGSVGLGGEDMENNRSAFFCAELLEAPVVLDLFNRTPVINIAEELMGKENVLPMVTAQPYPRFPLPPGEDAPRTARPHRRHRQRHQRHGQGGIPQGFHSFRRRLPRRPAGSERRKLYRLAKSHRASQDYFKEVGHEVLANGMPRTEMPEGPVMAKGKGRRPDPCSPPGIAYRRTKRFAECAARGHSAAAAQGRRRNQL